MLKSLASGAAMDCEQLFSRVLEMPSGPVATLALMEPIRPMTSLVVQLREPRVGMTVAGDGVDGVGGVGGGDEGVVKQETKCSLRRVGLGLGLGQARRKI